MDIEVSPKVANELRGIAAELEAGITNTRLYADLKASNQHCKRLAALSIDRAVSELNLELCKEVYVMGPAGYVNWHGLRALIELDNVQWLAEFDADAAPPHRRRQIQTPTAAEMYEAMNELWRESLEVTPYDEIENSLNIGFVNAPTHVETDRTADELREWYSRQAKAWASLLLTLASASPEREQTPLTERDQNILIAMLEINAMTTSPKSQIDIMVAATGSENTEGAFANLKDQRLVDSKQRVGTWLTSKGIQVAERLQQND